MATTHGNGELEIATSEYINHQRQNLDFHTGPTQFAFQVDGVPSLFVPHSSSPSLPLTSTAPSVESASTTTASSWLPSSTTFSSAAYRDGHECRT